jgi:TPR repeat protein
LCYADGDGVPADAVEAFKWISLAASHGHPPAVQLRASMEKKLTPEQKSRAEEQVKAFLAGPPK